VDKQTQTDRQTCSSRNTPSPYWQQSNNAILFSVRIFDFFSKIVLNYRVFVSFIISEITRGITQQRDGDFGVAVEMGCWL